MEEFQLTVTDQCQREMELPLRGVYDLVGALSRREPGGKGWVRGAKVGIILGEVDGLNQPIHSFIHRRCRQEPMRFAIPYDDSILFFEHREGENVSDAWASPSEFD